MGLFHKLFRCRKDVHMPTGWRKDLGCVEKCRDCGAYLDTFGKSIKKSKKQFLEIQNIAQKHL